MKLRLNRHSLFTAFFLATLALVPAGYNACSNVNFGAKNYETVTGNPFSSTQASSAILYAICSTLNRCTSGQVSFTVCAAGVQNTNGLGAALGLASGYNPYSTLESAENAGQISANSVATTACTNTINNLDCASPSVSGAYNPGAPNPFAGVPGMIPLQSCNQVYTPPPTGVNLEAPIELVDYGVSSNTSPTIFSNPDKPQHR